MVFIYIIHLWTIFIGRPASEINKKFRDNHFIMESENELYNYEYDEEINNLFIII